MLKFISHPDDEIRLGDYINAGLRDPRWVDFRAAIAFVKRSGTKHIVGALENFSKRGRVRITVGIDHKGSTVEGLSSLSNAVADRGNIWVLYNQAITTFHPKVYLFRNNDEAEVYVGSGNLTDGGLFTNYEGILRARLTLSNAEHASYLAEIEAALDRWSDTATKVCVPMDAALIALLHASGFLPTEAQAQAVTATSATPSSGATSKPSNTPSWPFSYQAVPPAPNTYSASAPATGAYTPTSAAPAAPNGGQPSATPAAPAAAPAPAATPGIASAPPVTFGMVLQNTDVGVGQTGKNTDKRSPEVFIPMKAVDLRPNFWHWPQRYTVDPAWATKNAAWQAKKLATGKPPIRGVDKKDWAGVGINLVGHPGLLSATIWFNPKKVDLRIRHEVLRAAGAIGDILLVQQAPPGASHDYVIEIVPKSDPRHAGILARLVFTVQNSKKTFNYF